MSNEDGERDLHLTIHFIDLPVKGRVQLHVSECVFLKSINRMHVQVQQTELSFVENFVDDTCVREGII